MGKETTSNVIRVCFGVFFTFTVSFTVAGYQAILPVLLSSGVYESKCGFPENSTIITNHNVTITPTCIEQQLRLDLMYTVSMSVVNTCALLAGFLVPSLGPRSTCQLGSTLITIGSLLFGLSSPSFEAYFAGYALMAAGGPMVAFPMLSLPSLFPSRMGMIFSLIVGAFDGSAAMMYFYQLVFRYTAATIRDIFLTYITFPALLFLMAPWLFPSPKKALELSEPINEGLPLIDEKKAIEDHGWIFRREFRNKEVFLSKGFLLLSLWGGLYITAKFFYIQNLNTQLLWITGGNEHETDVGSQVFSIILPASAIFMPVTSFLLDKCPIWVSPLVMAFFSIVAGGVSIVHDFSFQFVTMATIVFNRFLFFAAAPFICQKLYGNNKGASVVYGVFCFLGACVNYSNYLWTYLSTHQLNGSYLVMNVTLAVSCLVLGTVVTIFLYLQNKRLNRTFAYEE